MILKKWKEFRDRFLSRDQANQLSAEEAEFLPAVLEVTETPPSPVGRLVLWTVVTLLVIGLLWAFFGHVDEVAIADGKVIPVGQVKTVQAEDKGVVKTIYVKEGQTVKKGDLLIELDQTFSGADLTRIKKEVAYYNLEINRLLAERDGRPFVLPVADPNLDPKDAGFQMSLYLGRTNQLKAQIAAAEMNVRQNEAAISVARANKEKMKQLLVISRDKEDRMENLLKDDAVALFQVLDMRSQRMELEQNLVAQESEIARTEAALAQAREALAGVIAERDKDIAGKLVDDSKALAADMEELKKLQEKDRLARIVSPADGRVNQLAVHTVGGVVSAAQSLMEIVPDDVTLEIEAWALNKDIGFIQVGQKAEVKVTTFNFQKYGIIDAEVIDVSPSTIVNTDEKNKEQEAKYRLVLKPERLDVIVGDRKVPLTPGMTVSAEIKIRQKRIVEFFLDPFRKYQNEALRER
ncbi:MAG TPA: HlyD family type I secretion periplasmic adaptor subunit [Patescibacteria group bacterium]|nr:HlyD family type I secretion periplasmic adaptor subunit [Patescibacteria group bacterium]